MSYGIAEHASRKGNVDSGDIEGVVAPEIAAYAAGDAQARTQLYRVCRQWMYA